MCRTHSSAAPQQRDVKTSPWKRGLSHALRILGTVRPTRFCVVTCLHCERVTSHVRGAS
ncbi:unnamed protein product [Ixodes pacificus]